MPPIDESTNSFHVNDVSAFGESGDFLPLADGLDYKLHPLADEKSGCTLHDIEGVMGSAIKEMMAKMASALKQGKVGDMFSIATPARIH